MDPLSIIGAIVAIIGGVSQAAKTIDDPGVEYQDSMEGQKELTEHAAALNFKYGEQAADASFGRAMTMYKQTLADNSPAAQKQRIQEAGMNPALMYGLGGGTGMGQTTSSAAQGSGAAGQQAGRVSTGAERELAKTAKQQMNLQYIQALSDIKLKNAQAENINQDTKESQVDTETKTGLKDTIIANAKQQGKAQWLENIRTEYENETSPTTEDTPIAMEIYGHKIYGSAAISNQSFFSRRETVEITKLTAEADEAEATAILNNEKAEGYAQELLNGLISANAAATNAAANKLGKEFETGTGGFTPKHWVDWGIQILSGVLNVGFGKTTSRSRSDVTSKSHSTSHSTSNSTSHNTNINYRGN